MPEPTAEPATERPLRVVFLPPSAWDTPEDSHASPAAINPDTLLGQLALQGVRWRVINPLRFPWNPWAKSNAFFRGLDPLRALRVMLTHRNADAVVSVFESNALFILLLRRLLFFRPRVVLWDASTGNPWRPLRMIQRFVLPRYDGLMVLCSAQAKHIAQHHRPRGPIERIGYNVDHAFYTPAADAPGPDDGPVLAVGDDVSRDYATLVAAARRCARSFTLKTKWRPADATAAPANVTFLSQRLGRDTFRALYADALLVALPLHEMEHAGGVTALFEAMAMGKAIVATDTALTRDFVTDGEHALLVPPGDAGAMAGAIERLAGDRGLRMRLGQSARRRIEGDLSTHALAQRMIRFLRLLSRR